MPTLIPINSAAGTISQLPTISMNQVAFGPVSVKTAAIGLVRFVVSPILWVIQNLLHVKFRPISGQVALAGTAAYLAIGLAIAFFVFRKKFFGGEKDPQALLLPQEQTLENAKKVRQQKEVELAAARQAVAVLQQPPIVGPAEGDNEIFVVDEVPEENQMQKREALDKAQRAEEAAQAAVAEAIERERQAQAALEARRLEEEPAAIEQQPIAAVIAAEALPEGGAVHVQGPPPAPAQPVVAAALPQQQPNNVQEDGGWYILPGFLRGAPAVPKAGNNRG